MNDQPEHAHDYRPYVELRATASGTDLGWMRQLTASPRYPFQCWCGNMRFETAERAAAAGLVRVAELRPGT